MSAKERQRERLGFVTKEDAIPRCGLEMPLDIGMLQCLRMFPIVVAQDHVPLQLRESGKQLSKSVPVAVGAVVHYIAQNPDFDGFGLGNEVVETFQIAVLHALRDGNAGLAEMPCFTHMYIGDKQAARFFAPHRTLGQELQQGCVWAEANFGERMHAPKVVREQKKSPGGEHLPGNAERFVGLILHAPGIRRCGCRF